MFTSFSSGSVSGFSEISQLRIAREEAKAQASVVDPVHAGGDDLKTATWLQTASGSSG
jgi:hypothetical protein